MGRLFWKIYWKLSGWKIKGIYPQHIKKAVLVVAPHTSGWDVIVGMAARAAIPIKNAHFLGKKELFDGPFGWFFRWAGGVPVDRTVQKNMVEQVAEMFKGKESFAVALSPEGTRKKVEKLKTGFYHIAKQANVPMILAGLDFAGKQVILSEPFFAGDNQEEDIKKIISFFAPIRGKHPELGLQHLR
jgi:1-acyl-sn-glycerol-3-phosphate acyltransferase